MGGLWGRRRAFQATIWWPNSITYAGFVRSERKIQTYGRISCTVVTETRTQICRFLCERNCIFSRFEHGVAACMHSCVGPLALFILPWGMCRVYPGTCYVRTVHRNFVFSKGRGICALPISVYRFYSDPDEVNPPRATEQQTWFWDQGPWYRITGRK